MTQGAPLHFAEPIARCACDLMQQARAAQFQQSEFSFAGGVHAGIAFGNCDALAVLDLHLHGLAFPATRHRAKPFSMFPPAGFPPAAASRALTYATPPNPPELLSPCGPRRCEASAPLCGSDREEWPAFASIRYARSPFPSPWPAAVSLFLCREGRRLTRRAYSPEQGGVRSICFSTERTDRRREPRYRAPPGSECVPSPVSHLPRATPTARAPLPHGKSVRRYIRQWQRIADGRGSLIPRHDARNEGAVFYPRA